MADYTQEYDWQAVDEVKGWENQNMRENLHKVKVKEFETGDENTQWFNFTPDQTDSNRWKKHVDQWIERVQKNLNPSVT